MSATQITVQVDSDTMSQITGLSFDELEANEASIDFALLSELQAQFPNADVKASSFYADSVQIEAYDADGNPVSVQAADVMPAIERALKSI